MGLGNMARQRQDDGFHPDMPAEGAVSPVAAPAPAIRAVSSAGGPLLRGGGTRSTAPVAETVITEAVGDTFDSAPAAPEGGQTVASASSLEDALLSAGFSADDIPDEQAAGPADGGDPANDADAAAGSMPPAPDDEAKKDDEEDEDLVAGQVFDGDPSRLLNLGGLKLGRSHDVLVELLRSTLPQNEAVEMATEYSNFLQSSIIPRIQKLDEQKAERERRLQKGETEAGYHATGGGGVLSSLFSRLGRGDPAKAIAKLGNARRAILDEQSGFAERMRKRVGETKRRHYLQNLVSIRNGSEALARAVVAYNQAFLDAPAAADFKLAVLAHAEETGTAVDEIMANLGKRQGTDGLLAASLDAVRVEALADEQVVKAAKVMEQHEADIADALRRAVVDAEVMQKNFPETFNVEENRKHLVQAMEIVEESMPDPVAEEEEKRKLMERMAELAEALTRGFDALFARLAAKMGVSPA